MPIVATSKDAATGDGFDFSAGNQFCEIVSGVSVAAEAGVGVGSTFHADTLQNYGSVLGQGDGVNFQGNGFNLVINEQGASIFGVYAVDYMDNGSDTTENHGEIYGTIYGIFENGGSNTIDNYGYIYGESAGIRNQTDGGAIFNSGTISSQSIGLIDTSGAAGDSGSIINTGTIR